MEVVSYVVIAASLNVSRAQLKLQLAMDRPVDRDEVDYFDSNSRDDWSWAIEVDVHQKHRHSLSDEREATLYSATTSLDSKVPRATESPSFDVK